MEKRKLVVFSALYISLSLSADTVVNLEPVKSLSANSLLLTNNDKPLSIIRVPTLYTTGGNAAHGEQEITFRLHNDSNPVYVNGSIVLAGQTISFFKDVNETGGLDIPIYPASTGQSGDAFYTITLKVKSLVCPDGYTKGDDELCYKEIVIEASKSCPSEFTLENNSCHKVHVEPIKKSCPDDEQTLYTDGSCRFTVIKEPDKYECPSSYNQNSEHYNPDGEVMCYKNHPQEADPTYVCPAGYSNRNWGTIENPACTDIDAYVADEQPLCESQGGNYAWDGKNYVCSFREPVSIHYPRTCLEPGQYVEGNCVIKEDEEYALGVCPYGYSWSTQYRQCRTEVKSPAMESCPANFEMTSDNTQCEKIETVDYYYTCPANYTLEEGMCTNTEVVEPSS